MSDQQTMLDLLRSIQAAQAELAAKQADTSRRLDDIVARGTDTSRRLDDIAARGAVPPVRRATRSSSAPPAVPLTGGTAASGGADATPASASAPAPAVLPAGGPAVSAPAPAPAPPHSSAPAPVLVVLPFYRACDEAMHDFSRDASPPPSLWSMVALPGALFPPATIRHKPPDVPPVAYAGVASVVPTIHHAASQYTWRLSDAGVPPAHVLAPASPHTLTLTRDPARAPAPLSAPLTTGAPSAPAPFSPALRAITLRHARALSVVPSSAVSAVSLPSAATAPPALPHVLAMPRVLATRQSPLLSFQQSPSDVGAPASPTPPRTLLRMLPLFRSLSRALVQTSLSFDTVAYSDAESLPVLVPPHMPSSAFAPSSDFCSVALPMASFDAGVPSAFSPQRFATRTLAAAPSNAPAIALSDAGTPSSRAPSCILPHTDMLRYGLSHKLAMPFASSDAGVPEASAPSRVPGVPSGVPGFALPRALGTVRPPASLDAEAPSAPALPNATPCAPAVPCFIPHSRALSLVFPDTGVPSAFTPLHEPPDALAVVPALLGTRSGPSDDAAVCTYVQSRFTAPSIVPLSRCGGVPAQPVLLLAEPASVFSLRPTEFVPGAVTAPRKLSHADFAPFSETASHDARKPSHVRRAVYFERDEALCRSLMATTRSAAVAAASATATPSAAGVPTAIHAALLPALSGPSAPFPAVSTHVLSPTSLAISASAPSASALLAPASSESAPSASASSAPASPMSPPDAAASPAPSPPRDAQTAPALPAPSLSVPCFSDAGVPPAALDLPANPSSPSIAPALSDTGVPPAHVSLRSPASGCLGRCTPSAVVRVMHAAPRAYRARRHHRGDCSAARRSAARRSAARRSAGQRRAASRSRASARASPLPAAHALRRRRRAERQAA